MSKKWWLAIVLLVVLAVLLAIGIPALLPPPPGATYANYSRIEKGMTRGEVEALLGEPRVNERIDEHAQITWRNEDGDRINVDFDKNGLVMGSAWNGREENRTSLERLRDRVPFLARKPPGPNLPVS